MSLNKRTRIEIHPLYGTVAVATECGKIFVNEEPLDGWSPRPKEIHNFSYSPNGELAVALDTGVWLRGREYSFHRTPLYSVLWLDEDTLVSSSSDSVVIWDVNGRRLSTLGTSGYHLSYHRRLCVIDEDFHLRLFDREGNFLSLPGGKKEFGTAGFNSSGTLVASSLYGKELLFYTEEGDTYSQEDLGSVVTSMAFHPDGQYAYGTVDGEIILPTGKKVLAHTKSVGGLKFSLSGSELYSVGDGTVLRVKIK